MRIGSRLSQAPFVRIVVLKKKNLAINKSLFFSWDRRARCFYILSGKKTYIVMISGLRVVLFSQEKGINKI